MIVNISATGTIHGTKAETENGAGRSEDTSVTTLRGDLLLLVLVLVLVLVIILLLVFICVRVLFPVLSSTDHS